MFRFVTLNYLVRHLFPEWLTNVTFLRYFICFAETDLIPLLVTILAALLISLEYGIIGGIATNLVFILYSSARPKIVVDTVLHNVVLINFKTQLHYPAAGYIREFILEQCDVEKNIIVIDGNNIGNIDATVAKVNHKLTCEIE